MEVTETAHPRKPILCLDFDGVLHSYESGWQGADVIPDPPVPGAMQFLKEAVEHFDVWVYSSRGHEPDGIEAMREWLRDNLIAELGVDLGKSNLSRIKLAGKKPPAMVTLDDRAITFTGVWPSIESLKEFKPWNRKD